MSQKYQRGIYINWCSYMGTRTRMRLPAPRLATLVQKPAFVLLLTAIVFIVEPIFHAVINPLCVQTLFVYVFIEIGVCFAFKQVVHKCGVSVPHLKL